MRPVDPRRGFTLIEILIVISIIAVLASLILAGVNIARKRASIAIAKNNIESMNAALEQYFTDKGRYPGEKVRGDTNAFPELFEAIGVAEGKANPLLKYKEGDVMVEDEDAAEGFRQATTDDIYDKKMRKYLRDPWGKPYFYRENRSKAKKGYMHKRNAADIYSFGPNRNDDTSDQVEGEENDDIGNW